MCKKPTANLVLISGRLAKAMTIAVDLGRKASKPTNQPTRGPGQPAEHMRSLARALAQRVKVSIANTLNACVKLH